MKLRFILACFLMICAQPAHAQDEQSEFIKLTPKNTAPAIGTTAPAPASAVTGTKQPLEITADNTLEWLRDNHQYIARGNAIAKQGTTELHGDTLTANYVDGGSAKGMTIDRINADGNVLVLSDGSRATGQQGYYDVKAGYSELTGNNLSLKTRTDTVTASDKLTYSAAKREMTAIGHAKAVRGDDVITASKLIGRFINDTATGNTKLHELEAVTNVVIKTPTDTLYGDSGVYNAETNKAVIIGNVRIERGQNLITGARGEVDLNTNVSRIYGGPAPATGGAPVDPANDGRVRGVFYPE